MAGFEHGVRDHEPSNAFLENKKMDPPLDSQWSKALWTP